MSHEAKKSFDLRKDIFPQLELLNQYDMQFNSKIQFKHNFKMHPSLPLQPNVGYGLLILEVCRSHITKHRSCRTPLVEWSARRRDLYQTTHDIKTYGTSAWHNMLIVKKYTVITPEEFIYNFYYYVLIFIELYFSNFIPLTCFNVTIPDAV